MGNREFAQKLFNQAVDAATKPVNQSDPSTAFQLFASACYADPTWGHAHYQYGNNNFDLKRFDSAVAAYRRALQCELETRERAQTMLNLGWCHHLLGRTQDAYDTTVEANDIYPDLAQYYLHMEVLEGLFGNPEAAVRAGEQAVKRAQEELDTGKEDEKAFLERQLLECRVAFAFALLFNGHYKRGLELFEIRFEWRLHHFLQHPYPKWLGEPDKTVFLVADQGLGDTLSFSRFVELACKRAKYVHAYIQPQLMRVFLHSLGHVPNLNLIPSGNAYPEADAWTTFVSLPFALGLSDDEVRNAKQIAAPSTHLPTTWLSPDTSLHIGIAWGGSPLNDINQYRDIPVTQFLDLYRVPGIQLYSLQVGERVRDLHESGAVSLIKDLSGYINDVADTVALIKNMDLVICCESALGHICAFADRECWIPYSHMGKDYRIGYKGDKLLWTPKHRIFRQGQDNKWGPTFDEIVRALKDRLHGKALMQDAPAKRLNVKR